MGGRRDLVRRLHTLGDIGAILGVMKNLALMEIGKLSRMLPAQRGMAESLEAIAADFLAFHPQPGAAPGDGAEASSWSVPSGDSAASSTTFSSPRSRP